MKNLLLSLMISALLLSCAERFNNERIQFSILLLNNLDSAEHIIRNSKYFCGKDQILNKAWRDTNRSAGFIFVNDQEEIIGKYKDDYERDTSIFIGWDTLHFIVFQNKYYKDAYNDNISLVFTKNNGNWCFSEALPEDAIYSLMHWGIDYKH